MPGVCFKFYFPLFGLSNPAICWLPVPSLPPNVSVHSQRPSWLGFNSNFPPTHPVFHFILHSMYTQIVLLLYLMAFTTHFRLSIPMFHLLATRIWYFTIKLNVGQKLCVFISFPFQHSTGYSAILNRPGHDLGYPFGIPPRNYKQTVFLSLNGFKEL